MREAGMDSQWIPMICTGRVRNSSFGNISTDTDRPYVAVASRQGKFIDEHLALADCLWIYGTKDRRLGLVDTRKTPDPDKGEQRWSELAGILKDCRAVLAAGFADPPPDLLDQDQIRFIDAGGRVEEVLEKIFAASGAE